MGLDIITYQNHENDFWCKMGPFFAYRKFAHEMGGWQFYTKDSSIWFVAFIDNEIVGFNSIIYEKTHNYFDNFYIMSAHRGKSISRHLHNKRLEYALQMNREIRVITNNPIQINRYKKNNFIHYGMRGQYHKFKLYANTDTVPQQP